MRKFRYLIIVLLLAFDQIVKYIVRRTMFYGQSIVVIEGLLNITYVQNRGAAFNMFTGQNLLLTLLPIAAILFGTWYMEKHKNNHWTLLLSLELIISGGLGNLVDRFALGFVTDMIEAEIIPSFPVFNIADIAICVGCGFLVLYMFAFDKPEETKSEES